jgi:hypothetical protein
MYPQHFIEMDPNPEYWAITYYGLFRFFKLTSWNPRKQDILIRYENTMPATSDNTNDLPIR